MSNELRSYDAWKTTPPEDPEQEECRECEGCGIPNDGVSTEEGSCEACGGTGLVDPPTREEIKEEREEREFDRLHEEGRI